MGGMQVVTASSEFAVRFSGQQLTGRANRCILAGRTMSARPKSPEAVLFIWPQLRDVSVANRRDDKMDMLLLRDLSRARWILDQSRILPEPVRGAFGTMVGSMR